MSTHVEAFKSSYKSCQSEIHSIGSKIKGACYEQSQALQKAAQKRYNEAHEYSVETAKECKIELNNIKQFCIESPAKYKKSINDCYSDIRELGLYYYYTYKVCTHSRNLKAILDFDSADYQMIELKGFLMRLRRITLRFTVYDALRFNNIIQVNVPVYRHATDGCFKCLDSKTLSRGVNIIITKPASSIGLNLDDLQLFHLLAALDRSATYCHYYTSSSDSSSEFGEQLADWNPDYHIELHHYENRGKPKKERYNREVKVCPTMFRKSSELTFSGVDDVQGMPSPYEIIFAANQALSPHEWKHAIKMIIKKTYEKGIERYAERLAMVKLPDHVFTQYPQENMNVSKNSFYLGSLQVSNKYFSEFGALDNSKYMEIVFDYCRDLGNRLSISNDLQRANL